MEDTHVDKGSQSQLSEGSVQWAKRSSRVNAKQRLAYKLNPKEKRLSNKKYYYSRRDFQKQKVLDAYHANPVPAKEQMLSAYHAHPSPIKRRARIAYHTNPSPIKRRALDAYKANLSPIKQRRLDAYKANPSPIK